MSQFKISFVTPASSGIVKTEGHKLLLKSQSKYNVRNSSGKIRCISLNAQSVVNKSAVIKSLISIERPEILCLTETFLSDSVCSYEVFPLSYNIFRKDRNRRGHGLAIAVSNQLNVIRHEEFETCKEMLWCELVNKCKPTFICLFYRPYSSGIEHIECLRKSFSIPMENMKFF